MKDRTTRVLLIVVIILLAANLMAQLAKPAAAQRRGTYSLLATNILNPHDASAKINAQVAQGWDVVTITSSGNACFVLLRR